MSESESEPERYPQSYTAFLVHTSRHFPLTSGDVTRVWDSEAIHIIRRPDPRKASKPLSHTSLRKLQARVINRHMASKEPVQPPRERCHNCRRQRLRCDRSYPHCNKCLLAGKECLGYGQLFRWTGAIASRGKLAGKTSVASSSEASDSAAGHDRGQIPSRAPALVTFAQPGSTKAASASRPKRKHQSSPKAAPELALISPATTPTNEWQLTTANRVVHAAPPTPWVLADPLVQDLSHSYRHYLSYCKHHARVTPSIIHVLNKGKNNQSLPVFARTWCLWICPTAILSVVWSL